jgi:hypothetical protein
MLRLDERMQDLAGELRKQTRRLIAINSVIMVALTSIVFSIAALT